MPFSVVKMRLSDANISIYLRVEMSLVNRLEKNRFQFTYDKLHKIAHTKIEAYYVCRTEEA